MALVVGENSWVSLLEAEAYFADRIDTSNWDNLSDDAAKSKYLVTAFRWIRFDPEFIAPSSSTASEVKYGQCEAALFLTNYSEEYDKRAALIQSGVLKFQYSRWTENLGEVKKPVNVINYFSSVGLYNGGVTMVVLVDKETLT